MAIRGVGLALLIMGLSPAGADAGCSPIFVAPGGTMTCTGSYEQTVWISSPNVQVVIATGAQVGAGSGMFGVSFDAPSGILINSGTINGAVQLTASSCAVRNLGRINGDVATDQTDAANASFFNAAGSTVSGNISLAVPPSSLTNNGLITGTVSGHGMTILYDMGPRDAVFDYAYSATFGSLAKRGTGRLTIPDKIGIFPEFADGIQVFGGTVTMLSAVVGRAVVQNGGLFEGTDAIDRISVLGGGTLAAGAPTERYGTLTVNEELTEDRDATTRLFASMGGSAISQIMIGGYATLGGRLTVVLDGPLPSSPVTYPIISATNPESDRIQGNFRSTWVEVPGARPCLIPNPTSSGSGPIVLSLTFPTKC